MKHARTSRYNSFFFHEFLAFLIRSVEVRIAAILVLLMVGNLKAQKWNELWCRYVHTMFHENPFRMS